MNNHITRSMAVERLKEFGLEYSEFQLQNGYSVLCTKRGGRILGPFSTADSPSVFWLNSAFRDSNSFASFLKADDWNLGGDRFWVAPEHPFFAKKRSDFFDSYVVQKELDPGNYTLNTTGRSIAMSQQVTLKTFETDCKEKQFSVKRTITSAKDPLRGMQNYDKLIPGVDYCGFQQQIELRDMGSDTSLYLETWIVSQVNPAGKFLIPYAGDLEKVDYYEPISKDLYKDFGGHVEISATGAARYKLGFKAAQITGRSAYMGRLDNGNHYLFVRNFFNNPSNIYCADPYGKPGQYGCSLFLYNDNGDQGGFAEFENSGTTISGDTGVSKAMDSIYYYFYVGKKDKLEKIAQTLLTI